MSIPEEDAEARGVPLSLFLVLAPPSRVGEAGGLSSSLGLLLHLLFFPTGVAPLQPEDLVTNTNIFVCFFTKDCIQVLELDLFLCSTGTKVRGQVSNGSL